MSGKRNRFLAGVAVLTAACLRTGMMGTSSGWMMSQAGYRWMVGNGTAAPAWMTGGTVPAAMMSTGMMSSGADPGTVMGDLFAGAPGPRVSAAQTTALGDRVPVGAQVSKAANTVSFTTGTVRLTIVASPSGGTGGAFRAARLINPHIVVPSGGLHAGTLAFTAATPGAYRYLCPVPGYARDGMTGTFTVR